MIQPGRKYIASDSYRYGFNGKENDNEVKGEGNSQDYGMRIYDPRLGRFVSIDPVRGDYPELTPYQYASNRPIDGIDLDGLEWYYSGFMLDKGWKESKTVKPPPLMCSEEMKQAYYNKLGYLTFQQAHDIQQDIDTKNRIEERIRSERAAYDAVVGVLKSRNLFYLAYELSPVSSLVNSSNSFSEGNTLGGVINVVLAVGGLSELKGLGLGKFATANDFFNASKIAETSLGDLWKITNNLVRGTLIENKLAQTIYKQYEHLGSTVSKFFKYIDFYDNTAQIGISLKSVNAKTNFEFKNILKNIDDLAAAKAAGSIVSNGVEKIIKDVRLDLVIPKGYNKGVLKDVKKHAKSQGVKN